MRCCFQIVVEIVGVLLALGADQLVSIGASTGTSNDAAGGPAVAGAAGGGGGGAPGHIRRAVTRLGPNFVKIGQALASRPDLVGEAIAGELLQLQDAMPLFPNDVAREFIHVVKRVSASCRRSIVAVQVSRLFPAVRMEDGQT